MKISNHKYCYLLIVKRIIKSNSCYRRILTENFVGWKIMGLMGWIVMGQKMLGTEKREHRFHSKKRKFIQFNTAELLAASGPSPSSVHSYKLPNTSWLDLDFKHCDGKSK